MGKIFKYVLVLSAVVFFLLIAGLVGGYYWLLGYLKSDDFRQMVREESGKAFEMQVDLMPLHWTGSSIYTDGLSGQALGATPVRDLRADQLRANLDIYGVLDGVWEVPTIEVQRVRLLLAAPHQAGTDSVIFANEEPTAALSFDDDPGASAPEAEAAPSFLEGLLPTEVKIGEVSVQDVEVEWVPEGSAPITLDGLRVLAQPRGVAWDILGQNGTVKIPDWPDLQVADTKLRYTPEAVYVTEANLRVDNQGRIKLSGEVATTEDQQMKLNAQVQRVPLSTLLEGDWRMRILGNIFGDVDAEGSLSSPEGLSISGEVSLQDGRLEALPVLNDIAALTKYEDFRSVPLQKASAKFNWTPVQLEVRDLELKSEGLLIIQGWFQQEGIQIKGKLEVATVPAALRFLPGAEEYVFTRQELGYVWTEVNLSGTTLDPKEDLSERLKGAAVQQLGDDAFDTVDQVIDAAREFIPGFIP